MYSPLTRLLTILHLLNVYSMLTGDQLAAELEVDKRTVRRYVAMLRDLGVPVEAQAGSEGGYSLPPRYPLPPSIFSRDELIALDQALTHTDDPAVLSVRNKIKRLLEFGKE